MPKTAKSRSKKFKDYVKEFGDVFRVDIDSVSKIEYLLCKACQTRVVCDRKSQITQHIETQNHSKSLKTFKDNQKTIVECFERDVNVFNRDLCLFLVSNNIPFHRLLNSGFKKFIEKYTKYTVPSAKTLWENHLKDIYESTVQSIRTEIQNHFIWISIDETKDRFDRKVANVVIGSLNTDSNKCKRFVLNMEFIDNCEGHQIVRSVNTALSILWPEGIKYDKVLLLLTDAASYMKSAGRTLCGTYPKLIHVTCLAHGVHNVCEHIADIFTKVNALVSNGKKIIVKSNDRRKQFKTRFPDIPLPPEPVRTRWGTWINAVEYYAKYFDIFCDFVSELNPKDSIAIKNVQNLISTEKTSLVCDLSFINGNFNCLSKVLKQLETKDILLFDSIDLVITCLQEVENAVEKRYQSVSNKFHNILDKNSGFEKMIAINDVINGKVIDISGLNLTPEEISVFKSAPITACDVERSFSKYKFVLNDRRYGMSELHLKYYFIVNINNEYI
jgi:hypothetical protein